MKEILLLLLGIFVIGNCQGHKKVLLADVNTITLKDGQYTTGRFGDNPTKVLVGRRNAPVLQMKCVGGGAAHKYKPKVAQCTKTGFDGFDFQWRCTAEMPTEYEFGKITVSCEGFDHPDDPYILYGSCGLEYDLEYTADLKRNDAIGAHDPVNKFGTYLVIAFIICVVLYMIFTKDSEESRRQRSGGGGGPGYPPDSGYPDEKPPRGFPTPPPSYDESMGEARQRTNQQQREEQAYQYRTMGFGGQQQPGNNGPGFWTGAGLGALGGYMFGRRQQAEPTRHTTSYSQRRHTTPPSSSSGDMHQSTGYGGTSRR